MQIRKDVLAGVFGLATLVPADLGHSARAAESGVPRFLVRAVGVGYSEAAIATIYPLRHDIPMDVIVTEEGIVERSAS